MRPERFATFLTEALSAIATQAPMASTQLCECLQGQTFALVIDDEPLTLWGAAGRVSIHEGVQNAACRLVTSRRHLLALLDGADELLAALRSERLHIEGPAPALVGLFEALGLFVHGAVRAAAIPGLLEQFRAGVAETQRGLQRERG